MVASGCIMPRCSKNIYRLFDTKSDPMAPLAFGLRSLINTLESPWGGYPFSFDSPRELATQQVLGRSRACLAPQELSRTIQCRSLCFSEASRPPKVDPRPVQDRSRSPQDRPKTAQEPPTFTPPGLREPISTLESTLHHKCRTAEWSKKPKICR